MGFTNKQLDSFIALYKKQYGETIDRAEALKQATALVGLVDKLYKPMTKKEHAKYYGKIKPKKI